MARRRGRPPGSDSAETRTRIVAIARVHFATSGFDATTVSAVAAEANLAPSAIYHYFGGKAELYEAVFDATADAIWTDIGLAGSGHDTLLATMAALIDESSGLHLTHPHYSDFLALVPTEASLHPEFSNLMERRSKYQDATFGAMAELGLNTGELAGFDRFQATEMLRSLVMGWFFERYFSRKDKTDSGQALVRLIELLGER